MTAFVLVCTARYKELFDEFYTSFRIVYGDDFPLFVLTDDLSFFADYQCTPLKIEHEPWPGMVMHKYRNFLMFKDLWKQYDYVIFVQSNMIFEKRLPVVDAPIMYCYHPYNADKHDYICGGLVGGRPDDFIQMASAVQRWLDNHPNAKWHDETAINWYWRTFNPDAKILPSSTMYAEEGSGVNYETSIKLREKSKIFGSADKRRWT